MYLFEIQKSEILMNTSFQRVTLVTGFWEVKSNELQGMCYRVKFVNTAIAELNSITSFAIVDCIQIYEMVCFFKRKRRNKFSSKKGAHTRYKLIHKSHSQILISQNKICLQKSTKPFLCYLFTTHK